MDDREPQPSDGPEYHADHAAWERRQDTEPIVTKSGRVLTNADIEALSDEAERGYDVSKMVTRKHRGGVTLPEDCWKWLRATADRDGETRDSLIEGLVLLAMDGEPPIPEQVREARLFDAMAQMVMDNWPEDIIDGGLPDVVQRVFEHRDALREALVKAHDIAYNHTGADCPYVPDWNWVETITAKALEPYGRTS